MVSNTTLDIINWSNNQLSNLKNDDICGELAEQFMCIFFYYYYFISLLLPNDMYHFGSELAVCWWGGGKAKPEISRKERLQQLLTKHDMRMRAESSFTYADILQRIFQR